MIKHVVMWNARGESSEERAAVAWLIKSRFEELIGQVPGLLKLEVGVDFSGISYACDVVLYSEFSDKASLAGYAEHPAHLKIRSELEGLRTARHQVDYEV
ncbi:Dabb family protein [Rhizobium sp. LjRoot258]|jgi:hypothetical protein|uniref:Dabb family protein n=1 Tax=Rhizobium sp. LjRoot258 TaxID=3342299 RepID=UPI003ECC996B